MSFVSRVPAVDLHACGEPGRVITGGVPDVPGKTMFEKMQYLESKKDHLRAVAKFVASWAKGSR